MAERTLDLGAQPWRGLDPRFTIERGQDLEMGGSFALLPGDPVSHFGAGLAKTMASNVFLTGLPLDFALANTGFFTAPLADRVHAVDVTANADTREVDVELDNGVTRTARFYGSQGAITVPLGESGVFFEPSTVEPDPAPQQDCVWDEDVVGIDAPPGVDAGKLKDALDIVFDESVMTAACLVTHKGRLIAERYRDGIGPRTPLESWSMGKSVTATMIGRLIHQGVYELDQPAPIPAWQSDGDPRGAIRIRDILNMSSGLRFRAMQDPDYDASLGYPDHLYVYTGGIDACAFAAALPQQWLPGTVGRYRNCDPVLGNYLVRLATEGDDDLSAYHAFPQRALFDPLGITSFTIDTDPYGTFLTQGYEFATARDWARLGNLYLQDGVWNGERLLPEGFVSFASILAPGWVADKRPVYGGFFWINGDGHFPIPRDAYYMGGAGDQRTLMIPSHDLCVVRLGHYGGFPASSAKIHAMLAALLEAVPAS